MCKQRPIQISLFYIKLETTHNCQHLHKCKTNILFQYLPLPQSVSTWFLSQTRCTSPSPFGLRLSTPYVISALRKNVLQTCQLCMFWFIHICYPITDDLDFSKFTILTTFFVIQTVLPDSWFQISLDIWDYIKVCDGFKRNHKRWVAYSHIIYIWSLHII